jgi:hypothetical protein
VIDHVKDLHFGSRSFHQGKSCILVSWSSSERFLSAAGSKHIFAAGYCNLQEGFVDIGSMSYTALRSSDAKYIWHGWMYFRCTSNACTAAPAAESCDQLVLASHMFTQVKGSECQRCFRRCSLLVWLVLKYCWY